MREGRARALLLGILALGVLARLWPLTGYAIWGSDSGEYYLLTNQLLQTGEIRFAYDGWGLAYPYFPGMFLVDGSLTAMGGLDSLTALQLTVPVLAGILLPLGLYLVVARITRDTRVALLAAAILAVTGASVVATNHAMPGTLGHVLMMGAMLALLLSYDDRRALWALPVAGAALLITHHLTTYFLVGAVMAIALTRELASPRTARRESLVEAGLVAALLAGVGYWWLGVATPFREEIVGDLVDGVSPWLVAAACYVLALIVPAVVLAKRRVAPGLTWEPWIPGRVAVARVAASTFLLVILGAVLLLFFGVPGTSMRAEPILFPYLVPVLLWLSFFPMGILAARFHPRGTTLVGWLLAILGSTVYAAVTGSRVLFPFRHVEYLAEPLAALAAIGFFLAWDLHREAAPTPALRARRATAALVAAVVVVGASAAASQVPREVIAGFEEGMTHEELDAVLWARDNVPPGSFFAADHRVSSLLWGFAGMNATWDTAGAAYHGATFNASLDTWRSVYFPTSGNHRIDYLLLSPEIERGVTLYQWEPSSPMSAEAIAKFEAPPFETVYSKDGVRIYRVDWDLVASWEESAEASQATETGPGPN